MNKITFNWSKWWLSLSEIYAVIAWCDRYLNCFMEFRSKNSGRPRNRIFSPEIALGAQKRVSQQQQQQQIESSEKRAADFWSTSSNSEPDWAYHCRHFDWIFLFIQFFPGRTVYFCLCQIPFHSIEQVFLRVFDRFCFGSGRSSSKPIIYISKMNNNRCD